MQIGALLISAHSFHEIPQDLWEATDIRHSIDEAPAMSNGPMSPWPKVPELPGKDLLDPQEYQEKSSARSVRTSKPHEFHL